MEALETDEPQQTGDGFVAAESVEETDESSAPEVNLASFAVPASAPVSRSVQAKRKQSQVNSVYAQQYKSILVPLLLSIGAMLIMIGMICFFASGPSVDADNQPLDNPPLLGEKFKMFGLICAPMGLILLIGSYLFHMELSKTTKKK
jgi:hypothetical protein